MKVVVDRDNLLKVAADKGIGVADIAKISGMSQDTISKILAGTPVLLKTAARLFNGLGKDERIRIDYYAPA